MEKFPFINNVKMITKIISKRGKFNKMNQKIALTLLVQLSLFFVISCGGGSSSDDSSLVLDVTANTKTLNFQWSEYSGASHYKLFVNPDGSSGYTQIGSDIVDDDSGSYSAEIEIPIHHTDWVNASYILEAHSVTRLLATSDQLNILHVMIDAIGYFKASNTENSDSFGFSVALSGDGTTLAVGACNEDSSATGVNGDQTDNSATDSGAVYIFSHNGSVWNQQAYIKTSNNDAGDLLGCYNTIALSNDGNTLAVSAIWEDSSATGVNGDQADNSVTDSGAVYIFTRNGTDWSQQAYIKASNTGEVTDLFGMSVALSSDGNTLAVGTVYEDSSATGINGDQTDNSATDSGAVYIFSRNGTIWGQQAYIKASNTEEGDYFGGSVALSSDGNTLVVGAVGEDSSATGVNGDQTDNLAILSGAVYIFKRTGTLWAQLAYIKASNPDYDDIFGSSVALSDDANTLAVGAFHEASNATGINGDQFNNSKSHSGAVYIFVCSNSVWSQQAYIKASNTGTSDSFGVSIALSGDGSLLAVGAPEEDSSATGINGAQINNPGVFVADSGAVYLFTRNGAAWNQKAYIKASNRGGWFGRSVSLSSDGNTLAVGADNENGGDTGINGDQANYSAGESGAVYLY